MSIIPFAIIPFLIGLCITSLISIAFNSYTCVASYLIGWTLVAFFYALSAFAKLRLTSKNRHPCEDD